MDPTYETKQQFELAGKTYHYYRLRTLEENGFGRISRLPFSIRVLLESLIPNMIAVLLKTNMSKV